ncbi:MULTISPECIES: NYN domain-containing protein [Atopobiaceae]|uniref:NYN domain-containing protein n=1 Tax=Atopobiaceae TaxID=1643824 RepID=UPI00034E64A7|nr:MULTISPECIES: NYN domain-containing protein [Atopobiaceae]EPD78285.1 hypothetical protein HMPREF1527_00604 [Atopobium sp. oral taxon 199 str. F0494]
MSEIPTPQSSIAVFIDYENFPVGSNGSQDDIKLVFERLVDKGRITIKRAYCDWSRHENMKPILHELGVELIEIPDNSQKGKNSADIHLAVDALETCLAKEHIDTFAIFSGDSDFSPLVAKLKEYDKTVIGIGRKMGTASLLEGVCDEFIFYEDIVNKEKLPGPYPSYRSKVPKDKQKCYKLLFQTIDSLQSENDQAIYASQLKQTMKRKRPDFSETTYGYRSFTALLQEASRLGFIKIHKDEKTGTMVDGFRDE